MSKVRKVDFSPDEYLSGVIGMTMAEGHTYWVLCALIYSTGDWIAPDDERFRVIKSDPRSIRAALTGLANKGKIEVREDGKMMVRRCQQELERASRRMREAAENGARGGRSNSDIKEKQQDTKPDPLISEKLSPSPSPSPSSSPLTPVAPKGAAYTDEFLKFWEAYPNKVGKDAALRAWKKRTDRPPIENILAAVDTYVRTKPSDREWCNPATWINQGRWADAPPQATTTTTTADVTTLADPRWKLRVASWRNGYRWEHALWGPAPDEDGCQAPKELHGPRGGVGGSQSQTQHPAAL